MESDVVLIHGRIADDLAFGGSWLYRARPILPIIRNNADRIFLRSATVATRSGVVSIMNVYTSEKSVDEGEQTSSTTPSGKEAATTSQQKELPT